MKRSIVIFLNVGYWLMYFILVIIIFETLRARGDTPLSLRALFFGTPIGIMSVVPNVFSFYSFYFFVFSKYLQARKFKMFILASVVVSFLSSVFGCSMLFIAREEIRHLFYEPKELWYFIWFFSLIAMIHGVLALVIRGFIAWYDDIKIKEELNKKNFEMEMALVKSKLDPHFLFNTINNIDVLIGKDASKASLYLNKLSDIMRFMLYETKTERIALKKEWEYLEKYIELQKIRSSNPNFAKYSIEGEIENYNIAPMTLIPFVENAFKHGDRVKSDDAIVVNLKVENNIIFFKCSNKYFTQNISKDEYSGLGNELIFKRLALIYADKHTLLQKNENEIYSIELSINNGQK